MAETRGETMSMRKVKVRMGERRADARDAMFHQWGMDVVRYTTGAVSRTAAIVEYDDGQVEMVSPERVVFEPSKPDLRTSV